MIPLRDNQPTSTFPIITLLIIAANVLVFLAQQALPGIESSFAMVPYEITHHVDLNNVVAHMSAAGTQLTRVPVGTQAIHLGADDIFYGPSPHPLWLTIFSSMFMHANLLHIGGNMLFLWIFGNNIEDALGKVRFLVFYLFCGVAASAAQIVIDPNSLVPNLGASGAIAGVLAAYWLLYPNALVLTIVPIFLAFIVEIKAYWVLGFWFVLQIVQGVGGLGMQVGGGVAYFAHIGGFVAGLLLITLMGGKKLVSQQYQRNTYAPSRGIY